jgi:hypothetical protein
MRRADQFVQLYNQVADYLAKLTGESTRTPFYQLIERAATTNWIVRREATQLRKYGDLRNAIVHGSDYPREVIAEPTEETIARFASIVQRLVSPKRLDSFRKPIQLFSVSDKLSAALRYMRANDFSQIIVRENSELSLLTAEGIAKWLEEQVEQDIISVAEASISDALACDIPNSFKVMSREDTVDTAQAAFATAIEQSTPRLFAIIVTQNGQPHETPSVSSHLGT